MSSFDAMAGLPDRYTPRWALGLRRRAASLPLVRPKRADCTSALFERATDAEEAPHEHEPQYSGIWRRLHEASEVTLLARPVPTSTTSAEAGE